MSTASETVKIDAHSTAIIEYYESLGGNQDLQTDACCTAEAPPEHIRKIQEKIDLNVRAHYYGCGVLAPPSVNGLHVLDIGSGFGHDSFIFGSLVGPNGKVIGIDISDKHLNGARIAIPYHAREFKVPEETWDFKKCRMENLDQFSDGEFDLVVSNCVLNLSNDKRSTISESLRVLKDGGRLVISDVFSTRRSSTLLLQHTELQGECIAGAMYMGDLKATLFSHGINDFRVMYARPRRINVPEKFVRFTEGAEFYSQTVVVHKLTGLDFDCEDYGQIATYQGGILGHERSFQLDDHHFFEVNVPVRVCMNTARMLSIPALKDHFEVTKPVRHLGLFDCGGGNGPAFDDSLGNTCC